MTVNLPNFSHEVYAVALWVAGLFILWFWLRKDLTPARFLSIWETEGTLSSRQILAWVVALFGMFMRSAGRLDNDGLDVCLQASFILFGIGGAVKAVDKFKPATTVNANKVEADVKAQNVTVENNNTPDGPAPRIG